MSGKKFASEGRSYFNKTRVVDENGRLVGDVNFKDVQPKCKAITPVPGGVGTVTNAILVAHAVEAAKKQS